MKRAYVLHHIHIFESGEDEAKLIGIYSTEIAGRQAIERLKDQPGFCEPSGHFELEAYELDKDHWTEGYVTIQPGEE